MDSLWHNVLTFFLVANPIGNSPAILALIKDFPLERQKKIMLREAFFAFLIAIFFQYLAQYFLSALDIQKYAVTLCGGTILFLVALNRIFAINKPQEETERKNDPFVVPIATPLISGPGLLTMIMLKSGLDPHPWRISLAILLAWIGVVAIMVASPYLQKLLGRRGMTALEQFMGLLLSLVATNMVVRGFYLFMDTLEPGMAHGS